MQDRGARRAAVHGVAKSQTQLSNSTTTTKITADKNLFKTKQQILSLDNTICVCTTNKIPAFAEIITYEAKLFWRFITK